MSVSSNRVLTSSDVAQATAELIFALQSEFPSVRLVPCDSIEGEDIHLEAHVPASSDDQLRAAQDRAIELKHVVEDKYGIYALVRLIAI